MFLGIGSTATGSLSFTSTELQPVNPPTEPLEPSASENAFSVVNVVNPFSVDVSEAQSAPTGTGTSAQPGSGKKRKQSQVAAVLDDFLEHKKKRSEKNIDAMVEKKNKEEEYSIGKCVAILESMEDLSEEEMAKSLGLFKCEKNREIFVNTKRPCVQLLWLRGEINKHVF